MKTRFLCALALVGICLGGQTDATVFTLSGDMDVFQATTNPTDTGNGIGSIVGDYDDETNLLNYSIEWSDLTSPVSNMHFHVGAPGVPGGVDLGIPGPWTSPQVGTNILLSDSRETNLLAGNWYVNVHTQNFGSGEIRGQVLIPEPATLSLVVLGAMGMVTRRRAA